jgi:hypothetical protein
MSIFAGPKIVEEGLVFYLDAANGKSYPGTGTTWSDLSGLGNNTTLLNGVLYNSSNKGYFDFDGTNDYIIVPNVSYWNTNVFGTATNFTISIWAKADTFYNWTCLIQKHGGGGFYSETHGPALWINSGGFQAVFGTGEASNPTGSVLVLSYPTANTTNWFNLVFTGNGTNLRFYINGNLYNSENVASRTRPVISTNGDVRIGVRSTFSFYNGLLNMPMFYTRGLTAEEVRQNFEATRGRYGI